MKTSIGKFNFHSHLCKKHHGKLYVIFTPERKTDSASFSQSFQQTLDKLRKKTKVFFTQFL